MERLTSNVAQDGASTPQIQVEFDRPDEAVAGSILEGFSNPDVERYLGDFRIYANEVFAEARDQFDNYGTKDIGQTCYGSVAGVGLGAGIAYAGKGTASDPCGEHRVMEYLQYETRLELSVD